MASNEQLETKLNNLPSNSGVYQFINDKGKIIYVGKAKNLRNRVRSYFYNNVTNVKTAALVCKISNLELIVTDNEIEALVLENNLIKQFKPRYNVNLKDDKSYPYIKITNEPYPRIYTTRRVIKDGSKYFGPYTDVRNMKSSLRMINQVFKIRSCKLNITKVSIDKKKFKVCLDYHIKKCGGPCEGFVSEKEYKEMVDEVIKLLKGKTDDLIKDLKQKMADAVIALEFEQAAELRDRLQHLEAISSKQKIVSTDLQDRDIISIAYEGKDSACSIFIIRNGKLVGKKQLHFSIEIGEEKENIYAAAIKFYYSEFVEIPNELIMDTEPAEAETLVEWLNMNAAHKVKLIVPQRGELKSLVKMCSENARLQLKEIQLQKMKSFGHVPFVLSALQRDLRLKDLPRKIECFDISNLQGTDTVASMVVFEDAKPKKSLYRKFIIKDVVGPDDFSSMREVIKRRYSRLKEENQTLPDLIMVDGGKGQLSSAIEILNELGFKNYNVIGLAKRLEEVFFPNNSEPESIPKTSSGLKLLQQVRDEAHRFAITFHRQRRSKRTIATELTEIAGIGESTAQQLLTKIGSLKEIKESPMEKLATVIGKKKGELVYKHFNNNETKKRLEY